MELPQWKLKAQTIKSFLRASIPYYFFAASASINPQINVCIFYFTPRTLLFWFCGILLNKPNNNMSKWKQCKRKNNDYVKKCTKKKGGEVTTIATATTTAYATTAIIVKAHICGIKIHNHSPVVQFMGRGRDIIFKFFSIHNNICFNSFNFNFVSKQYT